MTITSIIILSYNAFSETTGPCLESVIKNTQGEYEIIVVDNSSTDGSGESIAKFCKPHEHIRVQLNDTNKGFAGGNNDGIKLARGNFLVLLNNDTLVPQGWLDRLVRKFHDDPKIGMIGPVTNSAGNEQRIELDRLNERNFERIAGEYIQRNDGIWFPAEKLGFYCVAIRKSVIDNIGLLDEAFGVGMFEDDDYCLRTKQAGFKMIVVEDCFVYHKGSFSFSKLSVEKYRELFENNRAYYRAKHGITWTFSDLAFSYINFIDREIKTLKKKNGSANLGIERISARMDNFQHLMVQVHEAEVSGYFGSGEGARSSKQAQAAFWKKRLAQFYNNFIWGSFSEKRHYLRLVARWCLDRIKKVESSTKANRIIAELVAIRKMSHNRKVIILPATIDFHHMTQRPQQLARAFSKKGYLVIYGTLNRQADKVAVIQKVEDHLYLVNETYFFLLHHAFKPQDTLYYCLWPNNIKHLDYLPYRHLIYDYMDDLGLLELPREQIEQDHADMLKHADLITVSSDRLFDSIPKIYNPKTLLINNAVSDDFIGAVNACETLPKELSPCGSKPVIGYYGALANWFDFDLVSEVASRFSDASIVLIGPVDDEVKGRLDSLLNKSSNVMHFPQKSQLELVPFLKRFDVCLIPFLKNIVTDAVSPVKLFEYFSAGKPVIATDITECRKYPIVNCSTNNTEFISAIEYYFKDGIDPGRSHTFIKFACDNTWCSRVDEIIAKINLKPANI